MEESRIIYACESDRITKEMVTHSTWEDMKENIKRTAEKFIGYLKLTPMKE